ncbi:MAG: PHP domain-containing protein [Waddliaceae bacterium]
MGEFRADLHCHSTCSDGTLSPTELIDLAKEAGLSGLSITDHDTICAYDTALSYAKKAQIEMIPGIEFSASHKGVSVHILGYAFSLESQTFKEFCQRHHERRVKRYRKILKLLTAQGMPISEEELLKISPEGSLGRPHIAQAMCEKGYTNSVREGFLRFLKEGQPCYVKGEAFSAEETLYIIHTAGGLAIIAHPHLIKPSSAAKELLELNFDGLEAYYARFSHDNNQQWIDVAEKKGWLITGGSDFHGEAKSHIHPGCSWTNETTFRMLQHHL